MYCRECGKLIEDGTSDNICNECKEKLNNTTKMEQENIQVVREVNNQSNQNNNSTNTTNNINDTSLQKSKVVVGLLGILFGSLGIHNFYLGYTSKAVAQLLLTLVGSIFTCGLTAIAAEIWAFVESIMIFSVIIRII